MTYMYMPVESKKGEQALSSEELKRLQPALSQSVTTLLLPSDHDF